MLSTDATAVGGTAAELVEIARNGAVALAEAGFWVVRLHYPIFNGQAADGSLIVTCSCGKPGCKDSAGKHPVDSAWGKGATRDVETVKRWFDGPPGIGLGMWKPWNVGIVMGMCDGIPENEAVLDVEDDTQEGRELAIELFGDSGIGGGLVYSSGKSLHRLFRWSPGLPPKADMTIRGLEFRSGNGKQTQSVAPPSMHQSGRRYQWIGDCPIIPASELTELPDTAKAFLQEEWERRQHSGSANGNGHAGGRSTIAKLHRPLGKIGVGERHASLLTFANSRWRFMCNAVGIARLEDSDIEDEILLDVLGRNLLVCDPPKTQDEVRVIVQSSRGFMIGEILREVDERKVLRGEEVDGSSAAVSEEIQAIGDLLRKFGIRLKMDTAEKNPRNRVDRWVAEEWSVRNLKGSDEDKVEVTAAGVTVVMPLSNFELPKSFARQVYDKSGGSVNLTLLVTPFWDFSTIWKGCVTSKKNGGITLGLQHYLFGVAKVVDDVDVPLSDRLEELIEDLLGGSKDPVDRAIQDYDFEVAKVFEESGKKQSFVEQEIRRTARLTVDTRGNLKLPAIVGTDYATPDEVQSGYRDPSMSGKAERWVREGELSRKYRAAFGPIESRGFSDAMKKLGYEKKTVRRGSLRNRWWILVDGKVDEGRIAE